MKFGDLFYYSKQMNKKKKSDRILITIGFLFPLIILMIVILFSSFLVNVEKEINNNEKLLIANIDSINKYELVNKEIYNSEFEVNYSFYINDFCGIDLDDKALNNKNIKNRIKNIFIANVDKNNPFFDSSNFKKEYNEEILLAGSTFTDEPGEIIISSFLADLIGKSYADLIGKRITIYDSIFFNEKKLYTFTNYQYTDISEYSNYKYKALNNFKIVGVFNSKLADYYSTSIYGCCLIKNTDVIRVETRKHYDENGALDYDSKVFDCDILSEIDSANKNYKYITITKMSSAKKLVLFNSFDNLSNYYNTYSNDLNITLNYDTSIFVFLKPKVELLYDIVMLLSIVIISLVLLNIIRIENYSIKRNMQFYSLTTKVGLEFKDILLLNILSITFDYIRSFILSLIIIIPSFIAFSYLINKIFSRILSSLIDYNLDWYYYISDLGFVFSVILVIVVFVSSMTVLKYKKSLLGMRK